MNFQSIDPAKTFHSTIVQYGEEEFGLMVMGIQGINHEIRFHGKEGKINANRAQRLMQAMIRSIGGEFVVVTQ